MRKFAYFERIAFQADGANLLKLVELLKIESFRILITIYKGSV